MADGSRVLDVIHKGNERTACAQNDRIMTPLTCVIIYTVRLVESGTMTFYFGHLNEQKNNQPSQVSL